MEIIADLLKKLFGMDLLQWVGAVTVFLNGLIALCLLIPGEQPEKALQGLVDWLSKVSKK